MLFFFNSKVPYPRLLNDVALRRLLCKRPVMKMKNPTVSCFLYGLFLHVPYFGLRSMLFMVWATPKKPCHGNIFHQSTDVSSKTTDHVKHSLEMFFTEISPWHQSKGLPPRPFSFRSGLQLQNLLTQRIYRRLLIVFFLLSVVLVFFNAFNSFWSVGISSLHNAHFFLPSRLFMVECPAMVFLSRFPWWLSARRAFPGPALSELFRLRVVKTASGLGPIIPGGPYCGANQLPRCKTTNAMCRETTLVGT